MIKATIAILALIFVGTCATITFAHAGCHPAHPIKWVDKAFCPDLGD